MLASLQHNSLTQLNLFTYTYPNENIHCQGIATAVVVVVVLFGTARIIISPSSPSRGRGVQVLPGLKKKKKTKFRPVPARRQPTTVFGSVCCTRSGSRVLWCVRGTDGSQEAADKVDNATENG